MLWKFLIGTAGLAAALEHCDSTLSGQQLCSDGTQCDAAILDCTLGPKMCLCGSQVHFCDSLAVPTQACNDGTPCSPEFLDCSMGTDKCQCGRANKLVGMQPSTADLGTAMPQQPQQQLQQLPPIPMKKPKLPQAQAQAPYQPQPQPQAQQGTASAQWWWQSAGEDPVDAGERYQDEVQQDRFPSSSTHTKSSHKGSRGFFSGRYYCDSTADRPQTCHDGTPCSSEFLDCTTKGPRRCICEAPKNPLDSSMGGAFEPRQGLMEQPRQQQLPLMSDSGFTFTQKPKHKYCDSTAEEPQTCQDGTPCSPQFLDCTAKGPRRCICGSSASSSSASSPMSSDWSKPVMNDPLFTNQPVQPEMQWQQEPQSMPEGFTGSSKQSWSKGGVVYCDSTAEDPQTCKNGTPCSPQFLDCTTKGPRRCICPAADSESQGQFIPSFQAPSFQTMNAPVSDTFSLKQWLDGIEMGHYENLFKNQALDTKQALVHLTDQQLAELGFKRQVMRNRIMQAVQLLQHQQTNTGPGFASGFNLRTWLSSLGMPQYQPYFEQAGLTSRQDIENLDDFTLKSIGIEKIGFRNRILNAVEMLDQKKGAATSMPSLSTSPFQQLSRDLNAQSEPRVPAMVGVNQLPTTGGQRMRFPAEWDDVALRVSRFFPSLPENTIKSSIVASKGDGNKALNLIRQSTGLEPQEYIEIVEEYTPLEQPMVATNPAKVGNLPLPGGRVNMPGAGNIPQQAPTGTVQMPRMNNPPQVGSRSSSNTRTPVRMPQMGFARDPSGHPTMRNYMGPERFQGGSRR